MQNIIIIGAGIVGMSVAEALSAKYPQAKIQILDKEADIGRHASGRNSGVLHSGIFYHADSFKAKVCAKGSAKMLEFAQIHQIPYVQGGKVIIPRQDGAGKVMDDLLENAQKNGVIAHRVDTQELLKLEPYAYPAEHAIYCPSTAIIDNKAVLTKLKALLVERKVTFIHDCKVVQIQGHCHKLKTSQGVFFYDYLFNCAGAYADQLAKMEGLAHQYTPLPFKGIYHQLSPGAADKIRSNIYPVPDVSTPFLGVHLTRSLDGNVYAGPTAIPVLGRENYHGIQGMRLTETMEVFLQLSKLMWNNTHDFRRLAKTEILKYSKKIFFQDAQKLMPCLAMGDLQTSTKAGIRPQLMNKVTKRLEMDYIFEQTPNSMHVLNAISPAFSSSFAFAELILAQAQIN